MGESFQCNMLDLTTYLTIPARIDLKDPCLIGMGIVFNIIMSDQDHHPRIGSKDLFTINMGESFQFNMLDQKTHHPRQDLKDPCLQLVIGII